MSEIMLKAYKYRIYPNLEQREYLVKTFGCTRFIYSQMLADRIKSYEENKDLESDKLKETYRYQALEKTLKKIK